MSAQLHVSPLPSDRTLSEARIEQLLRQGHTIGVHVEDGRQIGVRFDGTWYRAGVLRAKSLDLLKALASSAIR